MQTKLCKIIVLILISGLLNKFMVSCKEKNRSLKMIRGSQVQVTSELKQNQDFTKEITPYREDLKTQINEVLCFNTRILSRNEGELESSLGNFYADVCMKKSDSIYFAETGQHIDFALFNYGGIRTTIPKGDVRVEHIFKLMPFENKLVVVKMSGDKIAELFDYLKERKQAHPISGLRLKMKRQELETILINNKVFEPSKDYLVLTHDYLQHGGDNMSFFKDPLELYNTEYKVRDALIDYLRILDTLHATMDNRFIKTD